MSVIIKVTPRERPRLTAHEVRKRLGGRLPDGPSDPAGVADELAEAVEPGVMAMSSGRFPGGSPVAFSRRTHTGCLLTRNRPAV